MEIKVATTDDFQRIGDFERQRFSAEGLAEMQVSMKSWNEPWREESLQHYLNTGWCFIAVQEKQLVGFVLCQPLLFFQSWTQSLWVEYLSGQNEAVKKELLDVVWRWAKSKHLQRVFFNKMFIDEQMLRNQFPQLAEADHFQVPATKTN